MALDGSFDKPKRKTARCRNQEEAVCPVLKSQTKCREAEGYTPTLDSDQALIEITNHLDQSEVFLLFKSIIHMR